MPPNFENSAVATGLEKVNFHSNPKERQCQRMLKLEEELELQIETLGVRGIRAPGFSECGVLPCGES